MLPKGTIIIFECILMAITKALHLRSLKSVLKQVKWLKLSRLAFFVRGKMPNPPKWPFLPTPPPINQKGKLGLIHYWTLNLNISASLQIIKNLVGNFGAIYMEIMHARFQLSSFTGVGGKWGHIRSKDVTPHPFAKLLNSPFASLERDKTLIPN